MNETILSVQGVSFSLKKQVILDQISFSVKPGVVFGVVGHNGAGKTTLFHLILGLKIQKKGVITLSGKSNLNHESRSKLGYVPERPYVNLEVSFRSFLLFHAKLMRIASSKREHEINQAAELVGLSAQLNQELRTFSKGMLQKALIAQAVLGTPEILILDEPMSGLDPEARDSVRKLIVDLKNHGKTLIFSSHALEDVEQLADQVLILKAGKIEFVGSTSEWKETR